MNIRSRHHTGATNMWRVLLVLLALFATSSQQLVAQTHWHAAAATQPVAVSAGASTPDSNAATDEDCLLCQVAAHAGAAAPPPVSQQLVPLGLLESQVPAVLHLVRIPSRAHSWQSRGPPAI